MNNTDRAIIDAIRAGVTVRIAMTPADATDFGGEMFSIEARWEFSDPPLSIMGHFKPEDVKSFASLIQELVATVKQRPAVRGAAKKLREFPSIADIPAGCAAAPTAYMAPCPDARPIGRLARSLIYHCRDLAPLRTREEWQKFRRKVKASEQPIAFRGMPKEGVYAEWQTDG